MARLSETHIPDHPEWTQERKVKDFVTDRPARLRRDEEVYVLEEGGEWEKYPFEDDPGHYHLQRNSRPVR
ncbi:hypothetical protein FRC03_002980 [Tulasnella sp. 419]|nr:hypothetical protein FRC03_002980 [Tulasnella sp. 419]